jgi:ferrous iron transport protein B
MVKYSEPLTLAIAGNPNCGKSSWFGVLTGDTQKVGNWPGVTVEKKEGWFHFAEQKLRVVDLPGIYSLTAHSEDEQAALDYLLSGEADVVVQVVDASNLERNLYLTTQLLELGVKVILLLNMVDLAEKKGLLIDEKELSRQMGVPVLAVSANRNEDIKRCQKWLVDTAAAAHIVKDAVRYIPVIEEELELLEPALKETALTLGVTPRWLSVKLLEDDAWALQQVESSVDVQLIREGFAHLQKRAGQSPDVAIADSRYSKIESWVRASVFKKQIKEEANWSEKIDKVVLHRLWGLPFFFAAMYLVFWLTINVGGAFIDFFDLFFGAILVEGPAATLQSWGAPDLLITILADGVGAGLQTMSTFVPIIFVLFFLMGIMEDSGYMARAAFVMDRFMRWIGLPGKAFIPLMVGFGCTVPAIMATRTLENKRDRYLTVFMAPFMSCGARMPVYALFAAAFFPQAGQNIVFLLYISGIIVAVLTGLLLKKTLFGKELTPFIMELPVYHTPRWQNVLRQANMRLSGFVKKSGKVLVPVIVVLSLLGSLGTDGSFGNQNSENSVLSTMGKVVTPVFEPMGIEEDNWAATVSLFTGLFAKEIIVGTLSSLYSQGHAVKDTPNSMASDLDEQDRAEVFSQIKQAFASIPANLSQLGRTLFDPAGMSVEGTELQTEKNHVFSLMQERFHNDAQAFAYLLFVLLYMPCVAAVAAAYREFGRSLTILQIIYSTILAWIMATLFYQIAAGHEWIWILFALALLTAFVAGIRRYGKSLATN